MAIDSTLNPTAPADADPSAEVDEAAPLIDPVTGEETSADPHIAALLRERLGYVRRGDSKRVGYVEDELERLGFVRVERAEAPKGNRGRATK